jgi:ribosome-associated protein
MDTEDQPSKSARKREMLALQALGERLLELPRAQRNRITMPDALREALSQAESMKRHEARRRQLQYIGKLMRQVDAEPLREALDARNANHRQETDEFHALESLRDRLIADDKSALEQVMQQWPDTDRSQLRQLVRATRNTKKRSNDSAASERPQRKLFRYLQTLQAESKQADQE